MEWVGGGQAHGGKGLVTQYVRWGPGLLAEHLSSALAAARENRLMPSPTLQKPDLAGWWWGSVINILKNPSWRFWCKAQFESHWSLRAERQGIWGSHPLRQVYVPTSLSHSHLQQPESRLSGRTEALPVPWVHSPVLIASHSLLSASLRGLDMASLQGFWKGRRLCWWIMPWPRYSGRCFFLGMEQSIFHFIN